MITAAVFVPPDDADDIQLAVESFEYIQHRGYTFAGLFRQTQEVEQALSEGTVSIVVFARVRHANGRTWPAEYVDGCTRRLDWHQPPVNEPGHYRGPIQWTRERVSQILDGSGPVPRGLNPDAIAAARRIARHLSNCHDQQAGY